MKSSTVVGALLYYMGVSESILCVFSQCAGRRRLNRHPAGFQSVENVALRNVQPSLFKRMARD